MSPTSFNHIAASFSVRDLGKSRTMNRRSRLPTLSYLTVLACLFLLSSCGGPEKSGFRSGGADDRHGGGDFDASTMDEDSLRAEGLSFDYLDPDATETDARRNAADRDRVDRDAREFVREDDGENEVEEVAVESSSDRDRSRDRDAVDRDAVHRDEAADKQSPRRRKYSSKLEKMLAALKKDGTSADAAFRSLSFIDPALIPECLDLVASSEQTRLERIRVIVPDKNYVQHGKPFLVSNIPGMGLMEDFDSAGEPVELHYSKKSYNLDRRWGGYIVVVDNWNGFPLGVAVRAALLNRIQSRAYPTGIDHRRHLRSWWNAYYRNVMRRIERSRK